ncbi:ribonuclease Z [uncultured Muribaculum sp.]|uniref:ribonuclease Z n=1 Tax=uncultured Muribaculum sp. TaxID=1918613 RepID=UPI0025E80CF2|nr:ribonuclease Z [uncultured Muribaculum sp.]
MARFQVNYLGCGSATPTLRHLPSCQVVDFRDNLMMIDCGEGAQLSMRRARLKYSRLSHIFLSHLHGDHCLGLPGLLSTLALTGKDGGTITIHTFKEGEMIFRRIMDFFCRDTPFDIRYNIIAPGTDDVIWESDSLEVKAFPLIHRVPTTGFVFREKPKLRHIIGDAVAFHEVPVREMKAIKEGADFVKPDGTVIANNRLTTDADPSVSYAYCSDTIFSERVARAVEGVDVLYHEATYLERERDKAHARFHSTAAEAARVAQLAGVKRLVLGHFSKQYTDEAGHLAEAHAIFPDTLISHEGLKLDLL